MKRTQIIFTDSGLGGLSIMADFAGLVNNLDLDIVFFNAQYKRNMGYKTMDKEMQVEIFDRALYSMQKKLKANYIAIACNTLSVVFQNSKYKEKSSAEIYDIVAVGQKIIRETSYNTIIEISMPTTVQSAVYQNKHKNVISIASNSGLPDAIENNDKKTIDKILKNIFIEVKEKLKKQNLKNNKLALFLGCTHFPLIKNDFFNIAEKFDVKFNQLLNPNTEFARQIFNKLNKIDTQNKNSPNIIKVLSRVELKANEVENISKLINQQSPQTAQALINYEYIPDLF